MTLICHIAGPSGSGKTTLLKEISLAFPGIVTKDLDEFDDGASERLSLDSVQKKHWREEVFLRLKNERQRLMDAFLDNHKNDKVVFAGFHTEDHHILDVETNNKFLLDVDAQTSAQRAYERSQTEKVEHRRTVEDLPYDIEQAQKDIDFLLAQGYVRKTKIEIMDFIGKNWV